MDYMKIALEEAKKAYNKGEVPVGAVIVKDGEVIAKGHNLKETLNDVTAHAEINAIRSAGERNNNWRLNGCDMYVTLEPCFMCAAAIAQSRLRRLYIGTFDERMGGCGTIDNIINRNDINNHVNVIWQYDERCSEILKEFFKCRRNEERNKWSKI